MTLQQSVEQMLKEQYGLLRRQQWDSVFPRVEKQLTADYTISENTFLSSALQNESTLLDIAGQFTVDESFFFRHPEQVNQTAVLANKLLARKSTVTIVSAGCSAGQEPFSIAIALTRLLTPAQLTRVRIVACDLNGDAIERCRQGIYQKWSFRHLSELEIQQYFNPLPDKNFQLKPHFQKMVSFHHMPIQKLGTIIPSRSVDVIFFRNVAIYLDATAIEEIAKLFHSLLTPDGIIFTAPSDAPLVTKDTSPFAKRLWRSVTPSTVHTPEEKTKPRPAWNTDIPLRLSISPGISEKAVEQTIDQAMELAASGETDKAIEKIDGLSDTIADTKPRLYGMIYFLNKNYPVAADWFRQSYFSSKSNLVSLFWYAYSLQLNNESKRATMQWNSLRRKLNALAPGTVLEDGDTTSELLSKQIHEITGA